MKIRTKTNVRIGGVIHRPGEELDLTDRDSADGVAIEDAVVPLLEAGSIEIVSSDALKSKKSKKGNKSEGEKPEGEKKPGE